MAESGREHKMTEDETILHRVQLRHEGYSIRQVAQMTGTSPGHVARETNAVLLADLAESGDDPADVVAEYWKGPAVEKALKGMVQQTIKRLEKGNRVG